MKIRSLQEYTIEELKSKKKALKNATTVIVGLILISSIYFIAKLILGIGQTDTILPLIGMTILVITSSTVSAQLNKVATELNNRNKS
ncbi:MAG: hypothetical protein ACI9QN_002598 [Arcticibacterium sp.]|jgi:hypothetical protein